MRGSRRHLTCLGFESQGSAPFVFVRLERSFPRKQKWTEKGGDNRWRALCTSGKLAVMRKELLSRRYCLPTSHGGRGKGEVKGEEGGEASASVPLLL
ncbi:hypothetical protein BaRGS_00000593 [Batillaria attramentaria]|uniref:Uncharacterized protein n=1 Tax=Batillaria attramentaria TaxID=370345 RepID=A0ABD0M923_9CAEN